MIIYHGVWDLVYIFGVNWQWYHSDAAYIWQQWICWSFILISGFCMSLGSRTIKRGLTVFTAGIIISVVTAVAVPRDIVIFGILTLIGSSMLLIFPIRKVLNLIMPELGLAFSGALFFITRNISTGYLGFEGINIIKLPDILYSNIVTAYFGFLPTNFSSADYFPLFPWIFLFICGYFMYRIFQKYDILKYLTSNRKNPLYILGRNTLWIYMAHQPILYLVLSLIF